MYFSRIVFIEFCNTNLSADLISTIEFNDDGNLLAVGDKGGRIVVFQREQQVGISCRIDLIRRGKYLISDENIAAS